MKSKISVVWLRRDLRLFDNAALHHALHSGHPVLLLFIFDTAILNKLSNPEDARVNFIYQQLEQIQNTLIKMNSSSYIANGDVLSVWKELTDKWDITAVYTNKDYEPYATQRDIQVAEFLKTKNISFLTFKDQIIFEQNELLKDDGTPYTVFTPYSKKWKKKYQELSHASFPCESAFHNFLKDIHFEFPSLEKIGFVKKSISFPESEVDNRLIQEYDKKRDFPFIEGTSKLSVHLRFGTISIRELTKQALQNNEKFLNELIWREFYQYILWHFPHVVSKSFNPVYRNIHWENNEEHFEKWCKGQTGYPMVDAGMRALNATGYMHNRVRMITAGFLCKHLLIDWRWGEAYFADKLLDFDLASNNGGWQWAAGTGCDAAPYFRIFNPAKQCKKFDADLNYIQKWIPELNTLDYPLPIIDHAFARQRAIDRFQKARKDFS